MSNCFLCAPHSDTRIDYIEFQVNFTYVNQLFFSARVFCLSTPFNQLMKDDLGILFILTFKFKWLITFFKWKTNSKKSFRTYCVHLKNFWGDFWWEHFKWETNKIEEKSLKFEWLLKFYCKVRENRIISNVCRIFCFLSFPLYFSSLSFLSFCFSYFPLSF